MDIIYNIMAPLDIIIAFVAIAAILVVVILRRQIDALFCSRRQRLPSEDVTALGERSQSDMDKEPQPTPALGIAYARDGRSSRIDTATTLLTQSSDLRRRLTKTNQITILQLVNDFEEQQSKPQRHQLDDKRT